MNYLVAFVMFLVVTFFACISVVAWFMLGSDRDTNRLIWMQYQAWVCIRQHHDCFIITVISDDNVTDSTWKQPTLRQAIDAAMCEDFMPRKQLVEGVMPTDDETHKNM